MKALTTAPADELFHLLGQCSKYTRGVPTEADLPGLRALIIALERVAPPSLFVVQSEHETSTDKHPITGGQCTAVAPSSAVDEVQPDLRFDFGD